MIRKVLSVSPDLRAFLLFLLVAMLAWWPVAFLQNSLQWDMMDCFLPWRYQASECIRNFIFPFWNPYQQLGYPAFADLRTVFYPELWFVALAGGYSNYTLHFLVILYLAIGGWGFHKLARETGVGRPAALVAGMAYLLSGFYTGHGQDLAAITGATWIPLVLWSYLRFAREPGLRNLARAGIFHYLLVTGGYQALTILSHYLLILLFLWHLFNQVKTGDWRLTLGWLVWHKGLLVVLLLLVSAILVTIIQVQPFVSRFGGMTLASALTNPFPPNALVSLVLPVAVAANPELFPTDGSMSNGYFGLIILFFALAGFLTKPRGVVAIIIGFGFVCLLASFGKYLPVREFLFNHLPLMDLFRMPSFFRLFFMLGMILLAANGMDQIFRTSDYGLKKASLPLVLTFFFLGAAFLFMELAQKAPAGIIPEGSTTWFGWIRGHGGTGLIRGQFLFQGVLFGVLGFLVMRQKKLPLSPGLVGAIVFLEMGSATQLNLAYTGYNQVSPHSLHRFLAQSPEGFPTPPLTPLATFNDQLSAHSLFWRNTGNFSKLPNYEGFNSFIFDDYNRYFEAFPTIEHSSLSLPVLYYSDEFIERPVKLPLPDSIQKPRLLFLQPEDNQKLKNQPFRVSDLDRLELQAFRPGYVEATSTNRDPVLLTLQQSWFPGWKCSINGEPQELIRSNFLFSTIPLPAGINHIRFWFEDHLVWMGFLISFGTWLSLLLFFALYPGGRHWHWVLAGLLALGFGWYWMKQDFDDRQMGIIQVTDVIREALSTGGREKEMDLLLGPDQMGFKGESLRFPGSVQCLHWSQRSAISEVIDGLNRKYLLVGSNTPKLSELQEEIIREDYPGLVDQWTGRMGSVSLFSRTDGSRRPLWYAWHNEFQDSDPVHPEHLGVVCLDTGLCFGPGQTYRPEGSLPGSSDRLVFMASSNCPSDTPGELVMEVHRGGEQVRRESEQLGSSHLGRNPFHKTFLVAEIGRETRFGDEFRFYVWKNGGPSFCIDKLSLRVVNLPSTQSPHAHR